MPATPAEQLDAMLTLAPGWDGYGADAVTAEAVAAGKVILGLLDPAAADVQVCPARTGGVQVEWLWNGYEYELEITPAGTIGGLLGVKAGVTGS